MNNYVRMIGLVMVYSLKLVKGETKMDDLKLEVVYQHLKEHIKMENADEDNLNMMRALPICQAYLFNCFPSLGEHEIFSILLRFNKNELSLDSEEEKISIIATRLEDQVLSLVVCMVLQRGGGRLPYVALQDNLVYLCGALNRVEPSFFANVAGGTCLFIKKRETKKKKSKNDHSAIYGHRRSYTPPQFADADEDEDKEKEEDTKNEKEEEKKEDKEYGGSWVVLRSCVKYELKDADDKASIVVILEAMLKKQPLTIKTLRQRFHQDVGITFGECDVGGLLRFFQSYPDTFEVHETSKKKHKDSRISLKGAIVPTSSKPTQPRQNKQQSGPTRKGKKKKGQGKQNW